MSVTVCMGFATFSEKIYGTAYTAENIYGAWWFTALWAVLTAVAIAWFVKHRVRCFSTVMIHASFVVILTGAMLTHLTAIHGYILLRQDIANSTVIANNSDMTEYRLPFSLRLDKFEIVYHEGCTTPADYMSHISILKTDGSNAGSRNNSTVTTATVSMNNVFSHSGVRLYQSDYDNDLRGCTLAVNSDPWGTPVTFIGYAMLFLSFIGMLLDPQGTFRKLLRSPMMRKGTVTAVLALVVTCSADAANATTLPRETAEHFGKLNILYNGRICPVQTFAIDFTRRLYGRSSYNGYTAEQVLTGFMLWYDEWSREPIIKMKGDNLREQLQLPDYCSVSTFFNQDMGGYILGQYVHEFSTGSNDGFHRDAADIDDRLMLIMNLRHGSILKIFPYATGTSTTWHAPTDIPDTTISHTRLLFGKLRQCARENNTAKADSIISEIGKYQMKYGGKSNPTPQRITAERIYNAIPFATILFAVNLAMGFITILAEIRQMTSTSINNRRFRRLSLIVMLLSFAALTMCEALRWIIGGTIPLSNGYETMLFVAWTVELLSMIAARRFHIMLTFGFLISGFSLLVSHIEYMNPDITHVMPVLNSPLLSIHVSIIMTSFAMLSLTFLCSATAIGTTAANAIKKKYVKDKYEHSVTPFNHTQHRADLTIEALHFLSRLLLYPALAALAIGIFTGAIWANMAWGRYWGWDPKEVWALITMMVYAIAVHTCSLPAMRRPQTYHIFMIAAFITVLMTYFGVNYILGGMHSYA